MRLHLPLAALLALTACAGGGESTTDDCCAVTVKVSVPDGTDTVYLAGNLPNLGPWRPDGRALTGDGRERTTTVTVPPGTTFEYKFTLGSWDREALDPTGTVPPNHRLVVDANTAISHKVADFKKDPPGGVSLYAYNGELRYEYSSLLLRRTKINVGRLPEGEVQIVMEMRTPPQRAAPAELTFWINGSEVARGTVERTIPAAFTASEGFDVGMDTNSPVADAYFDRAPFAFTGKLRRLHFEYR